MVKKKKEKKVSPQKQKSRAKYSQPDELKELIRQANLVPIGEMTPDFEPERRMEIEKLRKENNGEPPEFSSFQFLTKIINHLPKEFLEHIEKLAYDYAFPFGESLGHYDSYKKAFVKEYIKYCSMRDSMYWLLRRIESERQGMRETETKHELKEGSLTFEDFTLGNWDAFPIPIRTALKRNDAGKLHTTGLAALIGTFDDSRLRRCEICQHIYWAKREDSKTCSPPCLNILNVRNSRARSDEEKAELKIKREANSQRNKKLKEIRRKK